MDKLAVYEMVINPLETSDVEVSFVALVDKPAIERNFLMFKDMRLNFVADPEKHIISGPAMVADTLIYRRDENGEYNVFFSKETIKEIALKFFKKDYHKNLNLFHDPALSIDGVTIFESFISDKERGISPMKGFEDLPDGTWFISAKVDNALVWEKVKKGEVKGFSVEGIFSYIKKPAAMEEQFFRILSETYSNNPLLPNKESIMSALKDMVTGLKQKFFGEPVTAPAVAAAPPPDGPKDYELKDGTKITCDKLEAGGVAMIGLAPAAPGDYELKDGTKLTVGDGGIISSVTPAMAAQVQPLQAPPLTMAGVELAIQKALSGHVNKLSEAEKTISLQKEEMEKQEEKIKGLFTILEKLVDTPTADPVDDKKDGFQTQQTKDKWARRTELANLLHKTKN